MEMSMGEVIFFTAALIVVFAVVMACVEAAGEQRKREREVLQRRG